MNEHLIGFYRGLAYNSDVVLSHVGRLDREYVANHKDFAAKAGGKGKYLNENNSKYYRFREYYNNPEKLEADYPGMPWSVIYYYINKTSYNGMVRYNSKGEFNVPFGHRKNAGLGLLTGQHGSLLAKTKILNKSFEQVIPLAGANDFVFCDPPYLSSGFTHYGNKSLMLSGFDVKQYDLLAQMFYDRFCKMMLVVDRNEVTENLFADSIVLEYSKNYSMNFGTVGNRVGNNHIVVTNY